MHQGPGLWDEVCSPKIQWRSLLALADLFVINRPHTTAESLKAAAGASDEGGGARAVAAGLQGPRT